MKGFIRAFLVVSLVMIMGCGVTQKETGGSSKKKNNVSYGWQTIGTAGFNGAPSGYLALAGNSSNLYLAYTEGSEGLLKRWNPGTNAWVEGARGTFGSGNVGQTELRLNNSGVPVVAYAKRIPPAGVTASLHKNIVDFDDWETPEAITAEVLNNSNSRATLGMDWDRTNNLPIYGFVDKATNDTVMVSNAAGNVLLEHGETKGVAIKYLNSGEYYMLMIKMDDRPAIMKYSDGSSTEISTDGASHVCIDATANIVYAAFVDHGAGNEITVIKNAASTPNISYIGGRGFTSGSGSISQVSMIVVSDNEIYISYLRGSKVFVERWNGSSWSSSQVNDNTINDATFPVIAYINGELYVAYDECVRNAGAYVSGGATVKKWGRN